MNLILLTQQDFISNTQVRLLGRRLEHLQKVHRANIGDIFTTGLLNNNIGSAELASINSTEAILEIKIPFAKKPPAALPLTLIIALPRPKMIKRILQTCATMGVKKIIFIHSYRVEKSYWQTPLLEEKNIEEQLILGLEQAKDTVMPEVILAKRFKPFVEDELATISENTHKLLAHPKTQTPCPVDINQATTLIVGPEGGFIPYEVEKLLEQGFESVHLGERILRTETAIPVLLSRLFC